MIKILSLPMLLGIGLTYPLMALMGAIFIEYVKHVTPCLLCLYQQAILAVIVLSTALGTFLYKRYIFPHIFLFLIPFLYFISFGISFYHVGIEQHIFSLPAQCQGTLSPHKGDIGALRDMLLHTIRPSCDEVTWHFAGLSMAMNNAFFSFFILCLWVFYFIKGEGIKRQAP